MDTNKSLDSKHKIQKRKERRYFSESARRSIVTEIDAGRLSKAEAARKYDVSQTSIYNWLRKYSKNYEPALLTVTEHLSDSEENKRLESELSKIYEKLGRLQAENMFLSTVIKKAEEHYGVDLKKNSDTLPSNPSVAKKKI